jgi:hypothetical protein
MQARNLRIEVVHCMDEIEDLLFKLKKFSIVAGDAHGINLALCRRGIVRLAGGSGGKSLFDIGYQGL